MKYFVLALMLVFCSAQAQAGLKTKLAIGAAGFVIKQEIVPALSTGAGMKVAVAAVKRLVQTPVGKNMVNGAIAFYIVTSANTFVGQKSNELADQSGLFDDPEFVEYLKATHANYAVISAQLEAVASSIDKKNPQACINPKDIYQKDLPAYLANISSYRKPVQPGDYGSYQQLKSSEVVKDQLDHDHIPSAKAIERYLLKRDGAMIAGPGIKNSYNNATALELWHAQHKTGATFRGRNIPLATVDGSSGFAMRAATIRDFAFYYLGAKLTQVEIAEFSKVYFRNKALCVYN
jgi:hypothetical protein